MKTGPDTPPAGDGAELIAGYIAAWQPSSVPPPAVSFARVVAGRAAPGTRARANALLRAAARLAAFGIPLGLQPAPEVLRSTWLHECAQLLGPTSAG